MRRTLGTTVTHTYGYEHPDVPNARAQLGGAPQQDDHTDTNEGEAPAFRGETAVEVGILSSTGQADKMLPVPASTVSRGLGAAYVQQQWTNHKSHALHIIDFGVIQAVRFADIEQTLLSIGSFSGAEIVLFWKGSGDVFPNRFLLR